MWNDDELRKLRKLQGARLKEARQRAGFKQAEDAMRRHGWKSTYRSHENGNRGMGRKYREYAKKFKVNPAWLLGHSEDRDTIVRGLKVIGDAAIRVWVEDEVAPLAQTPEKIIGVPTTDESDLYDRFGINVADASINKSIPQGAVAVCEEVDDDATVSDFNLGDMLYIERRRAGMRERSFKRVASVTATHLRLSTHSVDPKLKQEVTFPSSKPDETIRILGRVVGKYEDYSPN